MVSVFFSETNCQKGEKQESPATSAWPGQENQPTQNPPPARLAGTVTESQASTHGQFDITHVAKDFDSTLSSVDLLSME